MFSNLLEELAASFFMVEEFHEEGGSAFVQDVSEYLTDCAASHPRRVTAVRTSDPTIKSFSAREILFSDVVTVTSQSRDYTCY
jgi:hypothetical protein